MRFIDDIHNLWRFWSVRFGLLAGACATTLGAYAAGKAAAPEVVAHVPQWALDMLIYGSMLSSFASVISRGIVQTKLPPRPGDKP